jgi:hypothetical protein
MHSMIETNRAFVILERFEKMTVEAYAAATFFVFMLFEKSATAIVYIR